MNNSWSGHFLIMLALSLLILLVVPSPLHADDWRESPNFTKRNRIERNNAQWFSFSGKGFEYRFFFEAAKEAGFDAFIVDEANLTSFKDLLRNGTGSFNSYKSMKNYQRVTIEFVPPDDRQYYIIIDNSAIPDGGANYQGPWYDYDLTVSTRRTNDKIFEDAKAAFLSKDYSSAASYFEQVLARMPDDGAVRFNLALCYLNLERYQNAVDEFTRAIQTGSSDAKTYYNRGAAFNGLKQYDKAIEDFSRAISLDNNDPEAYFSRGSLYLVMDNHEKAINDLTAAIARAPGSSDAYAKRGAAFFFTDMEDKALADINTALKLNPRNRIALEFSGRLHLNGERYAEAIPIFSRAIEGDPSGAPAYWFRGYAKLKTGDQAGAQQDYDTYKRYTKTNEMPNFMASSASVPTGSSPAISAASPVVALTPQPASSPSSPQGLAWAKYPGSVRAKLQPNGVIKINIISGDEPWYKVNVPESGTFTVTLLDDLDAGGVNIEAIGLGHFAAHIFGGNDSGPIEFLADETFSDSDDRVPASKSSRFPWLYIRILHLGMNYTGGAEMRTSFTKASERPE